MTNIKSIKDGGIYQDLLREFIKNHHKVYVATPLEKKFDEDTTVVDEGECQILRIKTGNLQKTSFIKKGIATLRISSQFKNAIRKYFRNIKFDLVLYSTPPITLDKVVEYVKKRDNAKTFLLLKDIFPQNAVDLNILSCKGIKGIVYNFFKKKEKRLYVLSDKIGCMSQANVDYILNHNSDLEAEKLLIVPNSIEPKDCLISPKEKIWIREEYDLPQDKIVFIYGGNLGKPQNIPFVIECLKSQTKVDDAFFLIVGDGTEFHLLEEFVEKEKSQNVKAINKLTKDKFDKVVASCDVGMIFLDYRFTIPNYPSRLLAYMQAGLPVLACTDPNTDIGKDIVKNGFGWWCESNSVEAFSNTIQEILSQRNALETYGEQGLHYLNEKFLVSRSYKIIMGCIGNNE